MPAVQRLQHTTPWPQRGVSRLGLGGQDRALAQGWVRPGAHLG